MRHEISKRLLRKTALRYRQLLSQREYESRNEALMHSLLSFLNRQERKCMHVFLPIARNKEPDLSIILPKLWASGFTTVTSVTDFDHKTMKHVYLKADTDTKENYLGIPEPLNGKVALLAQIEVILIPLLVVDKCGNRIGYGGGYYDRLLKETKAIKVGLSLSNPVDKIIQTENWDIPLNCIVTPYKIYRHG